MKEARLSAVEENGPRPPFLAWHIVEDLYPLVGPLGSCNFFQENGAGATSDKNAPYQAGRISRGYCGNNESAVMYEGN